MGNFQVKLNSAFGLNPPIVEYLHHVEIGSFFYNDHLLRHPAAIFNLTASRLLHSISQFIVKLSVSDYDDLDTRFGQIIYNLFKFYDSSWEIIKCFCDPIKLSSDDTLWKSIAKNYKSTTDLFYQNLKKESDFLFLRDLYNNLKHTSYEIRIASVSSSVGKIAGYWLQGGDGQEGVGYDEMYFPISSTFELKRIYFLIFFIADQLQVAIESHLKTFFSIDIRTNPALPYAKDPVERLSYFGAGLQDLHIQQLNFALDPFERVHNEIRGLPKIYLKTEHLTLVKTQILSLDRTTLTFDVEEINIYKDTNFYKEPYNVSGRDSGDGITKTFKYFDFRA